MKAAPDFDFLLSDWSLVHFKGEWFASRFILIGFLKNLALHLERSPSIHSYGYGFSGDSPSCLANFSRNPDSFMQYAG